MTDRPAAASLPRISNKKVLKLVDLYKNEECLWNPNAPGYRDRWARGMAEQRIALKLDINYFRPCHVAAKFRNLRSYYCKELKKIATSMKPGAPRGDVYKPKAFWFAKIDSFLRPHVQFLSSSGTFTGMMADQNEGLEKANLEENNDDQSNTFAKNIILEIEVEANSDDVTEVERLSDNRQVDALADYELAEKELSPGKPLSTSNRAFVHAKHISVQTETEPSEAGRVLRKRKTPNNEETEVNPNVNRKLNAIARSYKKMKSVLESQVKKQDDVYDNFALYVASSLRALGTYEALALQPRIMELLALAAHDSQGIAEGSSP